MFPSNHFHLHLCGWVNIVSVVLMVFEPPYIKTLRGPIVSGLVHKLPVVEFQAERLGNNKVGLPRCTLSCSLG